MSYINQCSRRIWIIPLFFFFLFSSTVWAESDFGYNNLFIPSLEPKTISNLCTYTSNGTSSNVSLQGYNTTSQLYSIFLNITDQRYNDSLGFSSMYESINYNISLINTSFNNSLYALTNSTYNSIQGNKSIFSMNYPMSKTAFTWGLTGTDGSINRTLVQKFNYSINVDGLQLRNISDFVYNGNDIIFTTNIWDEMMITIW